MRKLTGFTTVFLMLVPLTWLAWGYPRISVDIPEGDISFSHSLHVVEQELECQTCHTEIENSAQAGDWNMPDMELCGDCHEVEDEDECGTCHKNTDDPSGLITLEREIVFNHQKHIEMGTDCAVCHGSLVAEETEVEVHLPEMKACLDCHDGIKADENCELCHSDNITLADIHPEDWLHQHREQLLSDPEWCAVCHAGESTCRQCHFGDNLTGNIHDLNYRFTHGLDAKIKERDCQRCHDTRSFCNDCHQSERRLPFRHSSANWRSEHGLEARRDIENCASCHDSRDPTCARSGCHGDVDGVRGTDIRWHVSGLSDLSYEGPWHSDGGYFCFQCHVDTRKSGQGFCGYCHR